VKSRKRLVDMQKKKHNSKYFIIKFWKLCIIDIDYTFSYICVKILSNMSRVWEKNKRIKTKILW
jgi:hypothetical protein